MSGFSNPIARSTLPPFNVGLTSASVTTMTAALGSPGAGLTAADCQNHLAGATVAALTQRRIFGHFQAEGIAPALDSLSEILDAVNAADPALFAAIGSAGMLCVRLRRPTSGAPSTLPSNHSWGTAIDITIDGAADIKPDGMVQQGIASLIKFFNDEGWFWGGGFSAEDDTHFEVADETIQAWKALGFLEVAAPPTASVSAPDLGALAGNASKDQLAKRAFDFFVATNWTKEQAAGLIANIEAESGFQAHGPAGDSGLAVGLCQWHPDRQANFRERFGQTIEQSSFDDQLKFVNMELREIPPSKNGRTNAGAQLKNAQTADEAGQIVCRLFESPRDPTGSVRQHRGQRAVFWIGQFGN